MIDGGEADDKIVAVLEGDMAYGHLDDIETVPVGIVDRLRHYFLSYKQLPDESCRRVEIAAVYGRADAHEAIRCAYATTARSMACRASAYGN